jgi:L-fuconolactonase
MQLIDAHVHFWDPQVLRYSWLAGIPALNKRFMPADLLAAAGTDLAGCVFVEADVDPQYAGQEVDWVLSQAASVPILGIVASAPLENANAAKPLLEKFAAQPLVKGIRRLIQSEPIGFATQPNFVSGVQSLAKYGLSFDICIRHYQLPDAIMLVEQCPEVSFVLDHIGKPDIAKQLYDPWKEHIRALARFPNVLVKLSGLVTEADNQRWTPGDLAAYIQHVIDCFGVNRIMFGSDWPVCTLASSYRLWLETLQRAVEHFSEQEKQLLFYENVKRFYRL